MWFNPRVQPARSPIPAVLAGLVLFQAGCAATSAARRGPPASADEAACQSGNGDACAREGRRLSAPATVPPEQMTRAVRLYERACTLGSDDGCSWLSGLYETGRGVPLDKGKAVAIVRASCERGAPGGCAILGGDLRDRLDGQGGEAAARAVCFEGPPRARAVWCALLAMDADAGRISGGRELVLQAFQRACSPESDVGCVRLASTLFRFGRRDEGLELAQRLCAAGQRGACADLETLGRLMAMEQRHGGPPGTPPGPQQLRVPDDGVAYDPPSDTWGTMVPTHEAGPGATVWRWWRNEAQIEVSVMHPPLLAVPRAAEAIGTRAESIARGGAMALARGAPVQTAPDLLAGRPCAHAWFETGLAGRGDVYVTVVGTTIDTLIVLQHEVFDPQLLERAKGGLRIADPNPRFRN
jgi:hypothetical protein